MMDSLSTPAPQDAARTSITLSLSEREGVLWGYAKVSSTPLSLNHSATFQLSEYPAPVNGEDTPSGDTSSKGATYICSPTSTERTKVSDQVNDWLKKLRNLSKRLA